MQGYFTMFSPKILMKSSNFYKGIDRPLKSISKTFKGRLLKDYCNNKLILILIIPKIGKKGYFFRYYTMIDIQEINRKLLSKTSTKSG